jgi:hypothetical protein
LYIVLKRFCLLYSTLATQQNETSTCTHTMHFASIVKSCTQRQSVCAEETARRLSRNAKATRYNTKWALPSHQHIMFNGSAKNIPPTPSPVPVGEKASRPVPPGAASGDRQQARRKSFVDAFAEMSFEPLRTPSGNTPMFPAEVYDAVFENK